MSIVSSSAGSNTAAGGTDVFDMSALKAAVAGAGTNAACQPPMQSKPRAQHNAEHREGAERGTEAVSAVSAEPTAGASGGGGGGDEDGQNTVGAAARAAAQPSIAPPADEKENMDPVCCCSPTRRDYAMLVRRNPEGVAVAVHCMHEVVSGCFPQRSYSLDAHLSSLSLSLQLTGRYHGASQAMASPPNRTRARQPFAERQVPQQAAQRRDIDNQQARDTTAPRRKALGEHLPVKGRDAGKACLMR
jgi:hypothetical protein